MVDFTINLRKIFNRCKRIPMYVCTYYIESRIFYQCIGSKISITDENMFSI